MAETPSKPFQPLFDRLTVPGQVSARPYGDATLLKQSVRVELERLLSCRSRLPLDRFLAEAADVLDYGIPDSTALTMASVHDRASLAKAIQRAITLFEPRLRDVTVDIAPATENGVDARVFIDAALHGAPGAHRTAFTMTTRGQAYHADGVDTRDTAQTVGVTHVGHADAHAARLESRDA
jgi:type VI secretion system protein ImpF